MDLNSVEGYIVFACIKLGHLCSLLDKIIILTIISKIQKASGNFHSLYWMNAVIDLVACYGKPRATRVGHKDDRCDAGLGQGDNRFNPGISAPRGGGSSRCRKEVRLNILNAAIS